MFITKCPYCKEMIKKEAVRCKHCHSNLRENGKNVSSEKDVGLEYLQNGFAKIHCECDAIEEKINLQTGFIFTKYQFSSDELLYAVSRIESFVDKMKDDLFELGTVNKFSHKVKNLFDKNVEDVNQRLESLQFLIRQREPTIWEKVKSIFKRIVEKLLSLINFPMIAGKVMDSVMATAA